MKICVPIKPFWYSDILVMPKMVTIITSLDKQGRVNAAPYSYFMQYDVMSKTPRVFLGMRNTTHTYKNIAATGEFVINFPPADFLDDIMETCRFYPEGINELEHTRFTPVPSQTVAPPSIKECGQIIECRLHRQYDLDAVQGHVIADISAIVIDEELAALGRGERIARLNLPISLGDENRKHFYFGRLAAAEMIDLKQAPDAAFGAVKTGMPWEQAALSALMDVPEFVRGMVVEMTENIIREEGADTVTQERFMRLVKEYAPQEVLDRFKDV